MNVALKWTQLTPDLRWPTEVLEKFTVVPAGYELMDYNDYVAYTNYHRPQYDSYMAAFSQSLDNPVFAKTLRVMSLVHPNFGIDHPSKIDFRRHLKPEVTLNKKPYYLANGREDKTIYTHQGVPIAVIAIEYETNLMNFITRRKKKLGYYNNAGEIEEYFLLEDQVYDLNDPVFQAEAVRERTDGRGFIMDQIRGFINGILAQKYIPMGKTYQEILDIAGQFWQEYSVDIDDWIKTGSSNLKNKITTDTQFDFLEYAFQGPLTVRTYIISKLSY